MTDEGSLVELKQTNERSLVKLLKHPSLRQLFEPKRSDRCTKTRAEDQDTYYIQLPNQWLPSPVLHPYRYIIDKLLRPEGPQRNSTPIVSSPIFQPPTFRVSSGQTSNSNANNVDGQFRAESFRYPETVSSSVPKFGDREPKSLNLYLPLYRAALKGDWEQAKWFLNRHPGAECTKITKGCETALHIAAGARHTKFVEDLVNKISTNDLELKNKDGNTALCFAAASGITRIAEVMVNKNINLPRIRGSRGVTPLYMATLLGHRDMVWYLYSVTGDEYLKLEDFFGLLVAAISSDLYDFALYILGRHPHLAIRYDRNRETALHVLARKPSAFASGSRLGIWERSIYPWIHVELPNKSKCGSNSSRFHASANNYDGPPLTGLLWLAIKLRVPGIKAVYEKKLSHMQALELVKCLCKEVMSQVDSQIGDSFIISSKTLFIATEFGIVEFVAELISSYPEFIWMVDDENRSLFHIAVMHRRAKIYSLIYSIGAHKDLITSYKDRGDNNLLHLAGKLAPSYLLNVVSGPALQMHRELLWFKEVEKIVQPAYKEMRDSDNRTPQMLFTEEHKGLAKEGEDWMKNTASSCMLVATLITTVMFTAIFTVPGGNNNQNGSPMFLQHKGFIVFVISDAFALFSSVTSVLIFLSVLTSRYAEEDFHESLPQRLSIGIAALFLSIVTMLVAFSTTCFIVLGHQWEWIVIPMALIACVPVLVFAFLQFPLLLDTIHSTFGSGIFSEKVNI